MDSPLAVQATTIFKEHYTECYDEEAMELINKGINPIAFPGLRLSITSDESRAINQATTIFKEHYTECYDEEAMELINKGINPIAFPGLRLSITSDESRAINFNDKPKVILSASGMCDAGRIKQHLKHNLWSNLWRRESTILFVGYQAIGTLGRALVEGATDVRLFGEDIHVNAEIIRLPGISGHADDQGLMRWASSFKEKPKRVFVGYQAIGTLGRALVEGATDVRLFGEDIHVNAEIIRLPGISGHADDQGLMRWASSFKEKPKRVFVAHGDDQVCDIFAKRLETELGYSALAPYSGTEVDLLTNEVTKQTVGIVVKHTEQKAKSRKAAGVFARLVAAGQRLMAVIRRNEGGANKDLAKFADQINSLCDKWDR